MELTRNIVLELLEHEAIVKEAYKDSEGIWTWGVGVTDRSGHKVGRYKDSPQTIRRCLEVYIWLLRDVYLPGVKRAFGNRQLSESELAGALSFHYNTGAIERASWVKSWLDGNPDQAYREFLNYCKPLAIIGRRKLERETFFKGLWHSDGYITVLEVNKPSYSPRWSSAKQVDVKKELDELLGEK